MSEVSLNSAAAKETRERYKVCPSCGHFTGFAAGRNFCARCGAKLLSECPGCRDPLLEPTARFCTTCGTGLVILEKR